MCGVKRYSRPTPPSPENFIVGISAIQLLRMPKSGDPGERIVLIK